MGPRRNRRGDYEVLCVSSSFSKASMGPRRNRRGDIHRRSSANIDPTLQWGHAEIGVETGRGEAATRRGNASMGPRRNRRGDKYRQSLFGLSHPALQWGHAEIGVETISSLSSTWMTKGLQWGHAEIGVETRDAPPSVPGANKGFNGATPK